MARWQQGLTQQQKMQHRLKFQTDVVSICFYIMFLHLYETSLSFDNFSTIDTKSHCLYCMVEVKESWMNISLRNVTGVCLWKSRIEKLVNKMNYNTGV